VFSGESVEENANLVIRLLIRRPECLGPALQGEGEGLMASIISGNKMSESIQVHFYSKNKNLTLENLSLPSEARGGVRIFV